MEELHLKISGTGSLEKSRSRQKGLAGPEAFQGTKSTPFARPTPAQAAAVSLSACASFLFLQSERVGFLLETQAPGFPENITSVSATRRDCFVAESQLQGDSVRPAHLDLSRPANPEY